MKTASRDGATVTLKQARDAARSVRDGRHTTRIPDVSPTRESALREKYLGTISHGRDSAPSRERSGAPARKK
jgi:hypothetical protein